jgi:mono/diheme cytochrome c family protein
VLFLLLAQLAATQSPAPVLHFVTEEGKEQAITVSELERQVPPVRIEVQDRDFKKPKHYRALPMDKVLAVGFPGLAAKEQDFLFKALDGYQVMGRGAELTSGHAFLAVEDLDVPGWEKVPGHDWTPAPFYLVWTGPEKDESAHPWPWALSRVEVARFESRFPHVVPQGAKPGSPPVKGFALFREHCLSCHAVNREGGRVGPDLNVPKNILEYRPEAQVRAYIVNPRTFRYSAMPAHPDLSPADVDALVAYFRVMQAQKHDSGP